jgi:ELWxxDGT repeat protein
MTGGRRRALERAQTATSVAALSLSTLAVGGLAWAPVAYAAPNDTVSLLKDVRAGTTGSNPTGLVAVGGTVFFRARDSLANGYELWKSDGTAAGTEIVKDIFPGDDSLPTNLTNVGGPNPPTAMSCGGPTARPLAQSPSGRSPREARSAPPT